jgi:outer membrane protein insertion porin family
MLLLHSPRPNVIRWLAIFMLACGARDLHAQTAPASTPASNPMTVCGLPIPAPSKLPPAGSPPMVYVLIPCFQKQGGSSVVEPQTYLYYMQTKRSLPSQDVWVPYNDDTEATLKQDFKRLWATGFLDDLSIETFDYPFANGVIGKVVLYDMEERQRVKVVDYTGTKQLESTKIDEKLKDENVTIRLDSFIDDSVVRKVKGVIRHMLAEKGFLDSTVTHAIKPLEDKPKLVNITFTINEGPKYKVRKIDFVGNTAISGDTLKSKMKDTKEELWYASWITGRGTYNEEKYADDTEKLVGFYRDLGYLRARVDNPEIRTLEDTKDQKIRYVELRIPVSEGPRYRIGDFQIADNKVVKSEALKTIFLAKKGDFYSEKSVRKGFEKTRELYGAIGYFEFTAYPDFKFHDDPAYTPPTPVEGDGAVAKAAEDTNAPQPVVPASGEITVSDRPWMYGKLIKRSHQEMVSTVDVTLHMQEGDQYFVNRITFVGNTVTSDKVIRREFNLVENGVFNAEALKYSVKRINQLGYFKPLEEGPGKDAVKVEKTPNVKNKVDVTVKLEEHNRNEFNFGAGFSELEGTFISGAFSTTNFLGGGETVGVSAQVGARAKNYNLSATEPYMFDRPLSVGASLFSNKINYLTTTGSVGYSEVMSGASLTGGYLLGRFLRGYLTYSYQVIDVSISKDLLSANSSLNAAGEPIFNPFLDQGRHIESRIGPSVVYNSVDNPYTPRSGKRITAGIDFAGGPLGGSSDYYSPNGEAIVYVPFIGKTAFGLRGQAAWIRQYGDTEQLPYYRRFYLGGENQIRGVDIRTVGPVDSANRELGGNKFVLFNAEYYLDYFGPVRLVFFHDAGQAYKEGDRINLYTLRTSSGAEVRFMVPVMNVPFRLIYSWNLYRDSFQPARGFKFAVGTMF